MPEKERPDLVIIIFPVLAIMSLLFFVVIPNLSTNKTSIGDLNLVTIRKKTLDETQKQRSEITDKVDWIETKKIWEENISKIEEKEGIFGIYIKDIPTGLTFEYNPSLEFYAASLYKIPIAAATMKDIERGNLSFNDNARYFPFDYSPGTGNIQEFPVGTEFSIKTLLEELLKSSDNIAQSILLRTLSEKKVIESFSKISVNSSLNRFYNLNLSTPKELGEMMEEYYYGSFLLKSSREYMFSLMYPTLFDDRLSPYLGAGYVFKHKIGNWESSWHDCGIVFGEDKQVVVCILSKETSYTSFLEVAKIVGEFTNSLY